MLGWNVQENHPSRQQWVAVVVGCRLVVVGGRQCMRKGQQLALALVEKSTCPCSLERE